MNVIVIGTDSLRADHVGCYPQCRTYSSKKVQTPNLDRLAAEGRSERVIVAVRGRIDGW